MNTGTVPSRQSASQCPSKGDGGTASMPSDRKSSQYSLRRIFGSKEDVEGDASTITLSSSASGDGPPTQAQIDLVRQSWERVSEIRHPGDDRNISSAHAFGLAFYDALFALHPEIRPLFQNIILQARALSGMVSFIARSPMVQDQKQKLTIREINARKRARDERSGSNDASIEGDLDEAEKEDDTETVEKKMRELGARHYFYNIQPQQFELAGPAFVSALKSRLGIEYKDEIGEAWLKATQHAAHHMRAGLEAQQAWERGRWTSSSSQRHKNTGCCLQ